MKLRNLTIYLITTLIFVSCSSKQDIGDNGNGEYIKESEVAFTVKTGNTTKTHISSDMTTANWNGDDRIYLWAYNNDNGSTTYKASEFALRYYGATLDEAVFIGNAEIADKAYDYRYLAVYPKPKSTTETTATFNISNTQSGKYDIGEYDIMVSDAVVSSAFKEGLTSDLTLPFNHLAHCLYIYIPEGKNLLINDIKSLEINFPCAVVGDVTFNITGLDDEGNLSTTVPVTTLSNGSSKVTLNLDEPIKEGSYVWAFINPTTVNGIVSFRATDVDGHISQDITTYMSNRELRAGKITPIDLTIPQELARTTLKLRVTTNNLGETPTKVTFTAPEGCFYRNGKNTLTQDFELNGEYSLSYYTSLYSSTFKSKGLTITYDSPNAIVTSSLSLSSVKDNQENTISNLVVPYLMSENFGDVSAFEKGTNPGGSSAEHVGVDLKDYKLTGWTGDRVGGSANKSIRTMCRLEGGMWVQALYKGRIDTAPLNCLKAGKTVKIKVTYKYSGSKNEYAGSKKGTPKFYHGYTSKTGTLTTNNHGNIEHQMGKEMEQGTTGSYTSIGNDGSYTSNKDVTNATRLSWFASVSRAKEFGQGGNYWLYIDDIKVQIVE